MFAIIEKALFNELNYDWKKKLNNDNHWSEELKEKQNDIIKFALKLANFKKSEIELQNDNLFRLSNCL